MNMSNEQKYFDALKEIAKDYMNLREIERDARNTGLSYVEYLEMSYENIQQTARMAIRGKRRPSQ